jgi:hypothetical protein
MEVHIVLHPAVLVVLHAHLDGVADPHPHERPGHLAVEGPVTVGGAIGEVAYPFDGLKLDTHCLGVPLPDRGREVHRGTHNRLRHSGVQRVGKRRNAWLGVGGDDRRMGGGRHEIGGHSRWAVERGQHEARAQQDCGGAEQRTIVSVAGQSHGSILSPWPLHSLWRPTQPI